MSDTEPEEGDACLLDPCALIRERRGLLLSCVMGFGLLGVIYGVVKPPAYEATAFLEVAEAAEVLTVEGRLRYHHSLYREVCEGDDDRARGLARRTRVRNQPRGSRLIGVTVTHREPGVAAAEADALAETFLQGLSTGEGTGTVTALQKRLNLIEAYGAEPPAADSLKSLVSAWQTTTAEYEKLAERYDQEEDHPAVAGARQRRDELAQRFQAKLESEPFRNHLDLGRLSGPEVDPEALARGLNDMSKRLETLQRDLPELRKQAEQLRRGGQSAPRESRGLVVQLSEPAFEPAEPTGPGAFVLGVAGACVGGFLGFLLALCGCCASGRKS